MISGALCSIVDVLKQGILTYDDQFIVASQGRPQGGILYAGELVIVLTPGQHNFIARGKVKVLSRHGIRWVWPRDLRNLADVP